MIALGILVLAAGPQDPQADKTFPEYGLTLTLPELEGLDEKLTDQGQQIALWRGNLGEASLVIALSVLDASEFRFNEPGDVSELVADNLRQRDDLFRVRASSFPEGKYGYAPFASSIEGELHEEAGGAVSGRTFVLCGLLQDVGYVLQVDFRPEPSEEDAELVRDFFAKGVRYGGPERDPEWTIDEIRERWLRDAPADLHKDFVQALKRKQTLKDAVIRTDHYIILTNASGGKNFARNMEKNYDAIAKTFPFEEVKGRRLMPVFLFRTPDQYYLYYSAIAGRSWDEAARSKGHAWRDYYATWYEEPGDPVHMHEAVHQIFDMRLRLGGGGSWFQEGVAEYMETRPNDRNGVARLVEKGRHTPLREFFALKSLLYSSEEDDVKGGSPSGDNYKQAALLIEFLREDKSLKPRFEDFLRSVGKLPRGNVALIEAALQEVYGMGIDELEAKWMAYCKKR